jgi:hypothetical protein
MIARVRSESSVRARKDSALTSYSADLDGDGQLETIVAHPLADDLGASQDRHWGSAKLTIRYHNEHVNAPGRWISCS